jgi:diguanylate cyclase (GGDEF)-like protein
MSKILLLETDNELIESLEGLFATDQIVLLVADRANPLVKKANEELPDLIILDTEPVSEEAFTACKKVKDRKKTENIPVIFLVSERDEGRLQKKCLQIGGVDCLRKPLNSRKMLTSVHSAIKRALLQTKFVSGDTKKIEIRDELSQEIENLHQVNRRLEETALIDRLTGLYDKSFFFNRLKEEFKHSKKFKIPISVIVLDIDSFGRVNDTFGHEVGDYVLMKIANVLLTHSRVADVVGRLEGTSFAIILPGIDKQSGIFDAEKFRIAINQAEYLEDSKIKRKSAGSRRKKIEKSITASVGVATFPVDEPVKNEIEFFGLAKKALDRAKTTGKNKTVSADDLLKKNNRKGRKG